MRRRYDEHPDVQSNVDARMCKGELHNINALSSHLSCPELPGQANGLALKEADKNKDDSIQDVENQCDPENDAHLFAGQVEDSEVHEKNRGFDQVDAGVVEDLESIESLKVVSPVI